MRVVVNARAPLIGPAGVVTPSSLCAPGRERSDPVSADGVLQESCYLLTVLLHSTREILRLDMKSPYYLMSSKILHCCSNKEAFKYTSFMKA